MMKRNVYSTVAIVFYLLQVCQSKRDGGLSISAIASTATKSRVIVPDAYNDGFDMSELEVPRNDPKNIKPKRNGLTRSLARDPMDRQADVWETIGTLESYKTVSRIFSTASSDGKKTFSTYHYKVLPIYWNGKTSDVWDMDLEIIRSQVQMAVENHSSQSWGKLKVTFEVVPQTEHVLAWAGRLGHAIAGAENILSSMGYTKREDYDGIIMVYHGLGGSGDYCCSGGKAFLGGVFGAVSYESSWRVLRHEMGRKY